MEHRQAPTRARARDPSGPVRPISWPTGRDAAARRGRRQGAGGADAGPLSQGGSWPAASGRSARGGRFGLLRLHELTLDVDLDLVAHDELAVEHHLEPHPEVLPVD